VPARRPPRRADGFAVPRPRQPAPRDGRRGAHHDVRPVPELCRRLTPAFFDDELHQRAGVEVGDRHLRCSRSATTRSATPPVATTRWRPRAGGPRRSGRCADEAFLGEPIEQRRDFDPAEPSNRSPPLGDHDLIARPRALEPLPQLSPKLRHADLRQHPPPVQLKARLRCTSSRFPDRALTYAGSGTAETTRRRPGVPVGTD
jgi:hypothetical protein